MGFSTWWKNKAADFIEEDLLGGQQSSFCRYRSSNGHCHLPHTLNLGATLQAGHAVWKITDRGPCLRTWAQQMACYITEKGPSVGGAESPVPWEQGGQRREIIATNVPYPPRGGVVKVDDEVRILVGIQGNQILLDDGRSVDVGEVVYPKWYPTVGLEYSTLGLEPDPAPVATPEPVRTPSELPRPGWIPDPDDPTQYRWWDGAKWTDDRAPINPGEGSQQPS